MSSLLCSIRRRYRARGRVAAVAFVAFGPAGCTAILFDDAHQCETTEDCRRRGVGFEDLVCSPERFCVAPTEIECQTSSDCVAALGVTTARCVVASCVNLITPDCPIVTPMAQASNDHAIVIGWMGALEGSFASDGIPIQQAAQLAFEEFQSTAAGLPPAVGGSPRRPLVMLACHDLGPSDEQSDDGYIRVAKHLAHQVRVPAIIGPILSGIAVHVVNNVTIPAGVLTIMPSATSPVFTDLDDDDLVWRTVPSDALQAIPLAEMVGRIESKLRTSGALTPAEDFKVVTVSNDGAYGQGLFNVLSPTIVFNGKSAAENQRDGSFVPISYADPAANGNTTDFAPVQAQIKSFRPHLIVLLGTNELIPNILTPLEEEWNSLPGAPPRPHWLLSDGGRNDGAIAAVRYDMDSLMTTPTLRQRLRGTAPAATGGALYEDFRLRYVQRFNALPAIYAANAYDAAYLLGYSIVAGGSGPVTGTHIAAGLMKMSQGEPVDVGPSKIVSTLSALGGGEGIDFQGASGMLDFDPTTGEAPNDIDVWCVTLNNQMQPVFGSTGIVYDAALDAVVGSDGCSDG